MLLGFPRFCLVDRDPTVITAIFSRVMANGCGRSGGKQATRPMMSTLAEEKASLARQQKKIVGGSAFGANRH